MKLLIIKDVISCVDKTHPKLGNLFAFSLLSAMTRNTLLTVGVPSSGKTTVNKALLKLFENSLYEEGLTLSSFRHKANELNNFNGLLVIDDLSKIDTVYSRRGTVTAFCGLAYDGYTSKGVEKYYFKIHDFNGSIIVGLQPQMVREISIDSRWETVVRDKSIRYYHFFFPTKPNFDEINVKEISEIIPKPKLVTEKVDINELKKLESYNSLYVNFELQSSPARSDEKIAKLLSSLSYLENKSVDDEMILMLEKMTKPLLLEQFLLIKHDFEVDKTFHNNLFYLITGMLSLNSPSLKEFYKIWGVSDTHLRRLINIYEDYFYIFENVIYPSEKFLRLREVVDPYV